MALIDLKSNLASFRSDFSTPSVATQTEMPTKQLKKAQQTQASRATVDRTNWIDSVVINDFKNTGPTGWQPGKFTLRSQLGDGKSPLIRSYDPLITNTYNWYNSDGKVSPHTGFYSKDNTYQIKATKKGFLAATYNTNSPVDDVYKKFSLQDEAYNPTYIKQPFIVRGIQRKGNETPQYWGFGSRSGFDDGLIRGGVVTVADRVVSDTVRIAKFMASPKGLLWIVKQVGLGLTNSKVEAVGGTFGRQTRIHTGVASLLSVPGTPFGLHFTRHGIPFANESASYENVIKEKQRTSAGEVYSRLIDLQKEFDAGKFYSNKIIEGLSKVKIFKTKSLGSNILSGLGGPGSVYGIGFTQIRRVTDTKSDAVERAARFGFTQIHSIESQYASAIGKALTSTKTDELIKLPGENVIRNSRIDNEIGRVLPNGQFGNYDEKTPGNDQEADLSTLATLKNTYTSTPNNPINTYATLAYTKINKDARSERKGDFRNGLEKDTKGFTGIPNDYVKNSLEGRYGFGKLGQVGADRSDPNKFLVDSKEFTKKKKDRFVLISIGDKFRGDKVTAIDIASPGKNNQVYTDTGQDLITFYFEDGEEGTNVMPFRCTMTGYSDSFTPGWDRIDIMGRPDGAYLYTTFERSVSFNFTVAALSRSEMIPMWRKLNYLSTYTMPDFIGSARPSGPFMRISIGSLFKNTPGFISSLTYTVPDDATWDIAEDAKDTPDAKQLPMIVDVAMSFTIVGDFRPQVKGRAYSLQGDRDWLKDSVTKLGSKSKSKSK
jgi:hypothetical protein